MNDGRGVRGGLVACPPLTMYQVKQFFFIKNYVMSYKTQFNYMPDSGGGGGDGGGMSASAAGIGSSAFGMAGTIISAVAQKKANEKLMDYQDEWKWRERGWALDDWKMQNEYNLPINQKKRLIEAGLNPALLYGKGGDAGTSAVVRPTTNNAPNIKAPDFSGLGSAASQGIMSYLAVQRQTAEIDQMQLQNELLKQKTEGQQLVNRLTVSKTNLTDAQFAQVQSWVDGLKQFDAAGLGINAFGTPLGYQASTLYNNLTKNTADINFRIDENARRELLAAKDADQIAARISLMAQQQATSKEQAEQIKANTDLLIKSGLLKQIDIDGMKFIQGGAPAANVLVQLLRLVFGK